MASSSTKASSQQRSSSRPNSVSSSVVTVKRAISLSSRSGPVPTALNPQSPMETKTTSANISTRTLSPDPKRRASAVHSRPNSASGITEGMGSLNRWSQSTASSKSSVARKRRNSSARRPSGSFGSLGGFASSQSPPPHRNGLIESRYSPGDNPQSHPTVATPTQAPTNLPPIITLPSLAQVVDAVDSPSTTTTITPATIDWLTPSVSTSGTKDYFGDNWRARSPQKQRPNMQRTVTAPSSLEVPQPTNRVEQLEGTLSSQSQGMSDPFGYLQTQRAMACNKYTGRDLTSYSGHSRSLREGGKESTGTEGESSASSLRSQSERERRRKVPSQKAMLSKALQKANHAVLLDNAQNFEGAMEAYGDACDLLQQVMIRSSGDDDRKKLEAIRNTYRSRVDELRGNEPQYQTTDDIKALPERPTSHDSTEQELFSPISDDEEDEAMIGTATVTQVTYDQSHVPDRRQPRSLTREQLPPRRQSLLSLSASEEARRLPGISTIQDHLHPNTQSFASTEDPVDISLNLGSPMEKEYMPPPLSPRRPRSPSPQEKVIQRSGQATVSHSTIKFEMSKSHHSRQETVESTSWLDTIDESGDSSASSVHSRTSFRGLRRKYIRAPSGVTEAEFDAALDAAVEAAYDDGFEPADNDDEAVQNGTLTQALGEDLVSHVRKNVEIAKQKVRDVEREAAIATATDRQARRLQQRLIGRDRSDSIEMEYGEDEAQEEERILEEMTRDYVMDDTEYDMRSKSALPRQSDSSGFSGRTWGSSIGSNPTTAGTSLSTVTENIMISPLSIHLQTKPPPPPLHPPPCGALPPPPHFSTSTIPVAAHKTSPPKPPSLGLGAGPGVRDRRLSGQNVKQLKIETNAKLRPGIAAPATQPSLMAPPAISGQEMAEPPKSASIIRDSQQTLPNLVFNLPTPQAGPRQASSTFLGPGLADRPPSASPAIPAPIRTIPLELESNTSAGPSSPARLLSKVTTGPGTLKKNFSSSSLRNARVSSTTPTASDDSPSTPMTTSFSVASLQRSNHALMMSATHTPADTTFITNGLATGGMHLFDNNIHSPRIPGSPNPLATNAPLPLEPCPESLLRRPFWLLRCVYHTVAHPRGGYISTRLFVPRDIWRVKNVKLKGVEEKVSNCDLLTAALLKLSKVDTLDADAVLEEMQSFENVLDQVQVLLVKKLGGEVGVQGMASLFKGSHTTDEAGSTNESLMSRSTNLGSKSYLSSWRKLRSKNSPGVGITPIMSGTAGKEGSRETLTMRSLPMTSNANPRLPKRDPGQVQCIGPQANYMGALARLCDAVQVLDQIACQVEDPGLRHSSQTHVGLELSTRHAAEFFGFYICRFVLNDIGMMLDKFIKRGSEWVMA